MPVCYHRSIFHRIDRNVLARTLFVWKNTVANVSFYYCHTLGVNVLKHFAVGEHGNSTLHFFSQYFRQYYAIHCTYRPLDIIRYEMYIAHAGSLTRSVAVEKLLQIKINRKFPGFWFDNVMEYFVCTPKKYSITSNNLGEGQFDIRIQYTIVS